MHLLQKEKRITSKLQQLELRTKWPSRLLVPLALVPLALHGLPLQIRVVELGHSKTIIMKDSKISVTKMLTSITTNKVKDDNSDRGEDRKFLLESDRICNH